MYVGSLEVDGMKYIHESIFQEATRWDNAVAITSPDIHIPAII